MLAITPLGAYDLLTPSQVADTEMTSSSLRQSQCNIMLYTRVAVSVNQAMCYASILEEPPRQSPRNKEVANRSAT